VKQAHPTKKGSGRKHGEGVSHGAAPKPSKGEFLGQHTNPAKAARRKAIQSFGGIRAYKRAMRYYANLAG
jgi:hypothetical protein